MPSFAPLKRAVNMLAPLHMPMGDVRVWHDGREVFSYLTGFTDADGAIPISGDEVYPAYSMTKLLTAALFIQALEEGIVRLEAPLADYIPEFGDMTVREISDRQVSVRKSRTPITLLHLITMTAGLNYDVNLLQRLPTVANIAQLAVHPLSFEPGSHWQYSLCHDALAAALEVAFGKPLRSLFRERFFTPLGMEHSCLLGELKDFGVLTPQFKAVKNGYLPCATNTSFTPCSEYDSGGAGLVCSSGDYARFLDAFASGRLVSKEIVPLLRRYALTGVQASDVSWPQLKGYSYTLGMRIPASEGVHDYGWGGAAGAYALIDFDRKLSLTFFTNLLGGDEVLCHFSLRDALYESLNG
ncbi:MAG: beta-lactamase family protein [Clostridiales bacterium]|nr:beta-lactamase family protein [Clostridiales bacterium]